MEYEAHVRNRRPTCGMQDLDSHEQARVYAAGPSARTASVGVRGAVVMAAR